MTNKNENTQLLAVINQYMKDIDAADISMDLFQSVINAMKGSYRFYHNFYHLQEMTIIPEHHKEELSHLNIKNFDQFLGIIGIAGFFHDIIYMQVDGSVDEHFIEILSKNLYHDENEWGITTIDNDNILSICSKIFKIEVKQEITANKINEFLSAVVAGRILETMKVDNLIITKIINCIEATIPFRTQDAFSKQADILSTIMSEDDVNETMYASVYLANKDCYNFSGYENDSVSDRLMKFLQNSWRLTLENLPILDRESIFAEYYTKTINGNIGFFSMMLDTEKYKDIFHHHGEYPTRFRQLYFEERTKELLQYGLVSHNIRFITSAIFAAFDVIDDKSKQTYKTTNSLAEKYIKEPKHEYFSFHMENSRNNLRDNAILESLSCEENFPSAIFDGGKAPIAKFIYRALNENDIIKLGNILFQNRFFSETDEAIKIGKAIVFIKDFANITGPDVFEVILKTMEKIYTDLDKPDRVSIIRSYTNLYIN